MPTQNEANRNVTPVGFVLGGVRGYVRATMEIEGTSPEPGRFLHDALFLVKGEGLLSIAVREPWLGHERGRVTIRCEAGDQVSTVDYEPVLWFDHPGVSLVRESSIGTEVNTIEEGQEQTLIRFIAILTPDVPPIRLLFKVVCDSGPIKPRVKAGVKPPR